MNPPSSTLGGKLPTLIYVIIRQRHRDIAAMESRPDISRRQKAAKLGISPSTYAKILSRGPNFLTRVQEAAASGDWSPIEDELFGRRGDYHLLPSFQKLLKLLGTPSKRAPRRDNPMQDKCLNPADLIATRTKFRRWLLLGEAAERFLTDEAVELLLRARK